MDQKISVGVLGATGMVGQSYIRLLGQNPWFEVTHVAASPRSAGKRYRDAAADRWRMPVDIPGKVGELIVEDASLVSRAEGKCAVVFSAVDMAKDEVRNLEMEYASWGSP